MTNEPTVEEQKKAEAQDFAPSSPAHDLGVAADGLSNATHKPKTQNLVHLEPAKRQKTSGEKLFNVATYGGVALVGNELASVYVMGQTKQPNWFGRGYQQFKSHFTELKNSKSLSEGVKKHIPEYISEGRLPFLLYACIGGMFMVPPVKWLEDNKGSIVRKFDSWIHGKKAEQDPHMIEAHKEMDDAPRQTWASLGQGRVITVGAAMAADASFGWKKSLTGKLLQGTWFEKYASLDHVAEQVAQGAIKLTNISEKANPEKHKYWKGKFEDFTWLLTLSTTLTALFYVTSKLLAKNEQKHEQHKEQRATSPSAPFLDEQAAPTVTEQTAAEAPLADKPATRVTCIAREAAIAQQSSPQLS